MVQHSRYETFIFTKYLVVHELLAFLASDMNPAVLQTSRNSETDRGAGTTQNSTSNTFGTGIGSFSSSFEGFAGSTFRP